MKSVFAAFLAMALCLFLSFYTSDSKAQSKKVNTSSLTPRFRDNGKIIDSLKAVYNFEGVEYENWEEDDATDSTLTVCFINSKKLPAHLEASFKEFKGIAASIHRSIVDTGKYKSYYIIFITKGASGNVPYRVHTAGMDVLVTEL